MVDPRENRFSLLLIYMEDCLNEGGDERELKGSFDSTYEYVKGTFGTLHILGASFGAMDHFLGKMVYDSKDIDATVSFWNLFELTYQYIEVITGKALIVKTYGSLYEYEELHGHMREIVWNAGNRESIVVAYGGAATFVYEVFYEDESLNESFDLLGQVIEIWGTEEYFEAVVELIRADVSIKLQMLS